MVQLVTNQYETSEIQSSVLYHKTIPFIFMLLHYEKKIKISLNQEKKCQTVEILTDHIVYTEL